MSSLGYFFASTHRSDSTQTSRYGALVRRAYQVQGANAGFRRVRRLAAFLTRRLNCGTGDSPCDLLGSSHFVGVGCLDSSWLAQWSPRAWVATNTITTTGTRAHRVPLCRAVCGPDLSVMFRSNLSKVGPAWRVGRPARPWSVADRPAIRRAWSSAKRANRRVLPGVDLIRTAVWPRPAFRERPTTRRSTAEKKIIVPAWNPIGRLPAQVTSKRRTNRVRRQYPSAPC
jgi:hypothetical protein